MGGERFLLPEVFCRCFGLPWSAKVCREGSRRGSDMWLFRVLQKKEKRMHKTHLVPEFSFCEVFFFFFAGIIIIIIAPRLLPPRTSRGRLWTKIGGNESHAFLDLPSRPR